MVKRVQRIASLFSAGRQTLSLRLDAASSFIPLGICLYGDSTATAPPLAAAFFIFLFSLRLFGRGLMYLPPVLLLYQPMGRFCTCAAILAIHSDSQHFKSLRRLVHGDRQRWREGEGVSPSLSRARHGPCHVPGLLLNSLLLYVSKVHMFLKSSNMQSWSLELFLNSGTKV